MNYNLNRFYHGLQELDINLSEDQIKQFLIYYEMLIEKNKAVSKLNLKHPSLYIEAIAFLLLFRSWQQNLS